MGPPPTPSDPALEAMRQSMLREVVRFFGANASEGWLEQISVQMEGPGTTATQNSKSLRPNVFIYFPTYYGERQHFNGCERTLALARAFLCGGIS